MLVDDDRSLLQLMQDVLERHPFQVATYWDPRLAKQALRGPKETLPAVIISDVMMPAIDGYTFLSELRDGDDTRDIPVIVITAKKNVIEVFRDLPNVFAFLEKPFSHHLLVDTIQRALRKAAEPR